MTLTSLRIDDRILATYPQVQMGVLKVSFSHAPLGCAMPSADVLKLELEARGMCAENPTDFPLIKVWYTLFREAFNVNPKNFNPSIAALVRRVMRGKELPSILPLVDAYNLCSVQTLFPIGGYDVERLQGELVLRYGRPGEIFTPLGQDEPQQVEPHHIVYGDDARVVCWLWNHKDAGETCITPKTRTALFCIDSIEGPKETLWKALRQLQHTLEHMGGVTECCKILCKTTPGVIV